MIEKKKTELYQELGLQARDLRFQHVMSIATRNNRIIMRMEVMVSQLNVNPVSSLHSKKTAAFCNMQSSSKCFFGALPSNQLYTLVTIFLVEPWRNITNIVTEVKTGAEPLLNPWHSAVSEPLCS